MTVLVVASEDLARVHNIVRVDRLLDRPHDLHRLSVLLDQEPRLTDTDPVLGLRRRAHECSVADHGSTGDLGNRAATGERHRQVELRQQVV